MYIYFFWTTDNPFPSPKTVFQNLKLFVKQHEISSKFHRFSSKDWGLCLRVCWLWCPSIGPWNASWETRCIKTCWKKSFCSFFTNQRQTHWGRSPHGLPFWWVLNQSLITCKKYKAYCFSQEIYIYICIIFFSGLLPWILLVSGGQHFSKSSKHVFFNSLQGRIMIFSRNSAIPGTKKSSQGIFQKISSRWWFHFFHFIQIPGETLHFDEHIFQMGGETTNYSL